MRVDDWAVAMLAVLDRHAAVPFVWGQSDCFVCAMDVVLAVTGRDPLADIRGTYKSASGARRVLRKRSCLSLQTLIADHFEPVPVARAQRGDLAFVDAHGVGVVCGDHVLGKGPDGMRRAGLSDCFCAFRVN